MRKFFTKLAAVLTTSSLALPSTACVYNFYINSATNAVIKSYADQTSTVIKSLVLGKEKSTDTSQTIYDMFNEFPNSSIKNQTGNETISSWEDVADKWGYNGQINLSGFDPVAENYFVATGSGSLTSQVNTYRTINDVFNKLGLVSGLNVIDNKLVYNLIKDGEVKSAVETFLNGTKAEDPSQMDSISVILKNLVLGTDWKHPDPQSFTKTIINPIKSVFNALVDGKWSDINGNPVDIPTTKEAFKDYMSNWKDTDDTPYSQWTEGSEWKLDEDAYENWGVSDFNFYRSGVLINHLFHQIGVENKISNPDKDPTNYGRFLGDIIGDHINLSPPGLDDNLMPDLMQYVNHLTSNPIYIITLIEAVVPIIKQFILQMPDSTQGVKNLTFGKVYPTDKENNSYNIDEVLEWIQYLITNPDEIVTIVTDLLHINGEDAKPGNSLTYDIKVTLPIFGAMPLPGLLQLINGLDPSIINTILDSIKTLISSPDVKGAVDNILDIYGKWIKQYDDKSSGINFDLTKFQDFLLNDTNGLLTILNKDVITALATIMSNPNPIKDDEYFDFYKALGGQVPTGNDSPQAEFRENSVLALLKRDLNDTSTPFGQLILILLGNSSSGNTGLLSFVIDSNNQWLKDNYTSYFDLNNKSSGQIYNQIMTTSTVGNEISNTLTYNFVYRINGKSYDFWIQCKSSDKKDGFTGTKNFFFTDIELREIR